MFNAWLPEQFKEHPDLPGIWVGNKGIILATRKGTYKMNPYGAEPHPVKLRDNSGYLHHGTFGYAHRLVAEVWIPNPGNLPCVNHKDECRTNNCIENLEWCSYKYNSNYGTRNERFSKSRKGKEPWNKDTVMLAETKAKMSASKKGKPSNTKGQKWYKDPVTGKHVYYILSGTIIAQDCIILESN